MNKQKYIFCSFHGDTNGLATVPILEAVYRYSIEVVSDHILVFGLVYCLFAYFF